MTKVKKLIEVIESDGFLKKDNILTNVNGIKYRFESAKTKYANAHKFMVKLFDDAMVENVKHNSYDDLIIKTEACRTFDAVVNGIAYTFRAEKSKFKGAPCGRISYKRLIKNL